jgi:hypothetical protein
MARAALGVSEGTGAAISEHLCRFGRRHVCQHKASAGLRWVSGVTTPPPRGPLPPGFPMLLATHGRPVFHRLAVKGLTPVRKSRLAADALRSGTAMACTSVVALEEIEDAARNRAVV